MERALPRHNEVWRHFKNKLYRIVTIAQHVETVVLMSRVSKFVDLNTTKLESEDLSRDVNALREEKERIMIAIAEDKGRQLKKEEMIRFLQEQTAELDEFDDVLVRKLVEQVVVHGDGTFTVEFKSGELVEL